MRPHPRERARARPLARPFLALMLAAMPLAARAANLSVQPPDGHVVESRIEDEAGGLPGATVELADFLWTHKAFAPDSGRDVRVTA